MTMTHMHVATITRANSGAYLGLCSCGWVSSVHPSRRGAKSQSAAKERAVAECVAHGARRVNNPIANHA